MIAPSPGTVIAIKFLWGEHWGIVAADLYGRLTVISNSSDKGCVTEDLWNDFIGNAKPRIVNELSSALPAYMIVQRARSMIGTRYAFWKWNCEDLAHWALGLEPKSPQRDAVATIMSLACLVFVFGIAGKRG